MCAHIEDTEKTHGFQVVDLNYVSLYLEDLDERVVPKLALKKVGSGANVSIFLPYDEGVFYGAREVGDAQVASPVQVYLDVRSFRGRGEEASQVLLEQVIRPAW